MNPRVLLVSNRLPVAATGDAAKPLRTTAGGLGTSLKGVHESGNSVWIGWPGNMELSPEAAENLNEALQEKGFVPVDLTPGDLKDYYDNISNGVLWPLFHYLIHQLPYNAKGWETYRNVNMKFAEATASQYQAGDLIWVHDYHLMLVPGMLREMLPDAQIGFFLHIPFPSSEIFRILPWREELLKGLMGADLIGFHTFTYSRHFSSSLVRILGADPEVDRVSHNGRTVHFGVFPIGIDVHRFVQQAHLPEVKEMSQRIRRQNPEEFLALGVDRLDYTKGIPRRLLAIERFLEKYPDFRGRFRFLQIAVPTRESSPAYNDFRSLVNELVGRINSTHGTMESLPVHLLYRTVDANELSALFLAADIMMVTPLRDGMNLVAKEFVASRVDGNGVLMISEFAGAAAELGESLLVNPYDIEDVADRIHEALRMTDADRRARMSLLAQRVSQMDAGTWARSFISHLASLTEGRQRVSFDTIETIRQSIKAVDSLLFLVDYDGTLTAIRDRPALAQPDAALRELVLRLSNLHRGRFWIVSGRHKHDLETWFPESNVGLVAEHGLWMRVEGNWTQVIEIDVSWKDKLRSIMASFAERTPGSQVEEKTASIAWHYRMADREFGRAQAKELRLHLLESFSNLPVHILNGKMCVEARIQGVHKGVATRRIAEMTKHESVLAAGDDQTDEDFLDLLPNSISIRIGRGHSKAQFRLHDPFELRALLESLASGEQNGE
ncbi:MAG: bifunctional alpha,alpha-trehalose-phosphate synthase (UDP-forming)/trehalose-phosphatase [Spirochaetia bacterium]|nr:bifunctional alpha,alpha-trehalose-phosphate synthase (UDP-forming)/trehalose-phosphatase [Spirochaetia bacterium]